MIKDWKKYLVYGLLMGVLALILQVTHYKLLVRDINLELFGFIIGILFLGIGVFLGRRLIRGERSPIDINHKKIGLSEREKEVLLLIAEGLSNQEIADRLSISLSTAKTHISRIYSKLNDTCE
jgi:DNA-binding CsgD family transcriptional regulator